MFNINITLTKQSLLKQFKTQKYQTILYLLHYITNVYKKPII